METARQIHEKRSRIATPLSLTQGHYAQMMLHTRGPRGRPFQARLGEFCWEVLAFLGDQLGFVLFQRLAGCRIGIDTLACGEFREEFQNFVTGCIANTCQ